MNVENKLNDLLNEFKTSNVKEIADHLDVSIQYQNFKAKTLDRAGDPHQRSLVQ